jgi:DNA-binding CsgD family transcriptional regulator
MLFFADLMCGPPDLRKPNCNKCSGPYQLTWREQLMLGYLSQGLGRDEISQKMGCSIKALSSYRRSIMRKVNISRYSDFVLWLGRNPFLLNILRLLIITNVMRMKIS